MGYNWNENIVYDESDDDYDYKNIWNFDPEEEPDNTYGPGISVEIKGATEETTNTLFGVESELDDAVCKAFANALHPITNSKKRPFKNCYLALAIVNYNPNPNEASAYIEIGFSAFDGEDAYEKLQEWVEKETTTKLLENAATQSIRDIITQFNLPQPKIKSEVTEYCCG